MLNLTVVAHQGVVTVEALKLSRVGRLLRILGAQLAVWVALELLVLHCLFVLLHLLLSVLVVLQLGVDFFTFFN